jgi:ABC-type dipeptide/oligopeptide/nickel transport system ATPase component
MLLADEPTSALDVTIQAEILDLVVRLREQQGLAVLMISHDIGALAQISDRLMVMSAGEVIESGPSARVVGAPEQDYTRELISAVPVLVELDGTSGGGADA